MRQRIYVVGLSWDEANAYVAAGWRLAGGSSHSAGQEGITVYREVEHGDERRPAQGEHE